MSSDFSIMSSALHNLVDLTYLDFLAVLAPLLSVAKGASQLIGMFV